MRDYDVNKIHCRKCDYLVEECCAEALLVGFVKHSDCKLIVHRLQFIVKLKTILECNLFPGLHDCSECLVGIVLEVMVELEWRV